jgi:hypothetical protein
MRDVVEHITARALLGTSRGTAATVPAVSGPLGQALEAAASCEQGPEQALLNAAAIVAAAWRAGAGPGPAPPLPPPAAAEMQKPAPPGAQALLARLLGGEMPPVLPEWLRMAAAPTRNMRAPHELLPELLEAGRRERSLRELVLPVLGQRGRWLAALNQEWRYAAGAALELARAEEQWQTGTLEERVLLLTELRRHDPALARTLVESTWTVDPPEQRARFLECFAANLSLDDEPFLEAALDDKRKPIRTGAAGLLAALPESRLVQRMVERAAALVTFERPGGRIVGRGGRIRIELPAGLDAAMARDGMGNYQSRLGKRTGLLEEILWRVPPAAWCRMWECSAAEVVRAALRIDEKQFMLQSLCFAAEQFGDAAMAEQLLDQWLLPHDGPCESRWLDVVRAISPQSHRERIVLELLARHKPQPDAAWCVLHALDHDWSRPFSEALTPMIHRMLQAMRKVPSDPSVVARRVHPALAEDLIAALERCCADNSNKIIDSTIALLRMRHACWKEFENA